MEKNKVTKELLIKVFKKLCAKSFSASTKSFHVTIGCDRLILELLDNGCNINGKPVYEYLIRFKKNIFNISEKEYSDLVDYIDISKEESDYNTLNNLLK